MSDQANAAVEVQVLRKRFGDQKVLDGITLTVQQGETLAVLGRSGTGKSVLLKLLVGLEKPDAGSIRIHGQEITGLELEALNAVRAKVGFLFQEAALYDSLSVAENVAFPMRHRRQTDQASRQAPADPAARVTALLSFVGMEEAAAKMPAEISGGMKRRVGLARALALQPDILLFDEPTAGLDPITAVEIETLILKLRHEQGVTAIVVTHDVRGAKHVADRLALLHEGAIVIEGTFADLERSRDPFVSQFLREAS